MKYSNREKNIYQNQPCQESFFCRNCGGAVSFTGAGTKHRNHCPHCLFSLHVDDLPGDRSANCSSLMEPISIWIRKNQEWAIIHRCRRCGHLSSNRIAADDNPIKLMSIAVTPLSSPPFPLEKMTQILTGAGGGKNE
ncbi:RNHCP domain-containing protein [uncultured Acetobacterium sp.]|jgi:hypothetical protein|uniref:RNHCP domain-containing protein n=1 Tax=uncultured Acetobacterium sp. TaxID=217139 RepID=UPI00242503E6|nr:RNHCP domain-containing protein [uncultured Acetobacterium sp.]MBU4540284.1 RNHCP domain-containing protein [Bacillota bacterium]